jgi:hypothetical protein
MPPKKKPGFTSGNVLSQVQQSKRTTRLDELKELTPEQLTESLIRSTTQITVLKKWGSKLGVPGLMEFKAADSARLRDLLVFYLKKFQSRQPEAPQDLMGETVPALPEETKSEPSHVDQLAIIVKFIQTYSQNPKKVAALYGEAGKSFEKLWNTLSRRQKVLFVSDYLAELEVLGKGKAPSEKVGINPIEYLKSFIENTVKEQKETVDTPATKYLRAFIQNYADAAPKWESQMAAEAPRLEEFLNKFGTLTSKQQIRFAGEYVRYGQNREVLSELEKFLSTKPALNIPHRPIGRIQAPGYYSTFTGESVKFTENLKNRYKKCSDYLNQKKWVLFNDGVIPSEWLGDLIAERKGWAYPTPQFYQALCFHQSRFRLQDGRLVIYLPDKAQVVQVGKESSGKILEGVPELVRDLEVAQRDNIFAKLSPEWVLNIPLYQVESIYIDQIKVFFQGQYEDIFANQFSDLVKKCRTMTLLGFYHTFLATFYPCFAENNFPIASQVKKGYITAEYYYQLSDTQRVNSIKISELREYLRKWLSGSVQIVAGKEVSEPGVASWLVSTAGKNFRQVKIPKLSLPPGLFYYPENETCEAVRAEWNVEDIVIYQGDCFVAADLLERFLDNDRSNPLHPESQFDDQFYEVVTRTFFPRFRGARFESKRFPVQYKFVNKPEYEWKNQPEERKKVAVPDVSGNFDSYFGIKRIILEPVALIENLLQFEIPPSCAECKDPIEAKNITSLVNRSDGSIIKVDFCTYQCMLKHDFTPVHTLEEEVDSDTDFFEIV